MGLDRFTRQPAHAWHLDALEHAPRPDGCTVPSLVIGSAFEAGAVMVGLLRSLASTSRSLRSSFAITA
jgi:hypothetical protein